MEVLKCLGIMAILIAGVLFGFGLLWHLDGLSKVDNGGYEG